MTFLASFHHYLEGASDSVTDSTYITALIILFQIKSNLMLRPSEQRRHRLIALDLAAALQCEGRATLLLPQRLDLLCAGAHRLVGPAAHAPPASIASSCLRRSNANVQLP